MWKAYKQMQKVPEKSDWEYAEEIEMLPEKDFRRDIRWERLLYELNEDSK